MREHLSRLHHILATRFSEEELRTLCFEVDVPYEDLPAQGAANKARELIAYLDRRGRIPQLVEAVKRSRPDIPWGDIPEEPPSDVSGQVMLPGAQRVYHNLPQPDYGTFIGRQEELAQVHRILQPYPNSRHAMVTIDGIGGIGKSALALEVAHRYLRDYDRLPEEERFDAIIWASAKAEVLTADGITPRRQVTRTLDDIYTTIAVTLEREDTTRARHEERDELMARALARQRTLLVVDNLETVDDEKVNAFLRELPAPTKAIVTTRHRIDVAYPVRLTGMPEEDALNLIAHECEKKGVTLTKLEAERLYQRTGGVPLAMEWSVAQMGFGYGVDSVLQRLGQPTGDIARFCFEGAMERIRGTVAHKLLMALSLFVTDASREALGYVAGLGEDILSRDEGLVSLERLSLVNKQADRFWMLPLTSRFVEFGLVDFPRFRDAAETALIEWYIDLTTQSIQRGQASFEIGVFPEFLSTETRNLLSVLRLCYKREDLESALRVWDRISNLMWVKGFWSELECYDLLAVEAARELSDLESYARFCGELSWFYIAVGRYEEAIEYTLETIATVEKLDRPEEEAYCLRNLGEAYARRGNLEEARSYLQDSLRLAHEVRSESVEVRALGSLAALEMKTGNYVEAYELYERCWRKNRQILERDRRLDARMVSPIGVIVSLRGMGDAARELSRHQEARRRLQESLRWAQTEDVVEEAARSQLSLAKLEALEGNSQSAKSLAQAALKTFNRLGLEQEADETEELLNVI